MMAGMAAAAAYPGAAALFASQGSVSSPAQANASPAQGSPAVPEVTGSVTPRTRFSPDFRQDFDPFGGFNPNQSFANPYTDNAALLAGSLPAHMQHRPHVYAASPQGFQPNPFVASTSHYAGSPIAFQPNPFAASTSHCPFMSTDPVMADIISGDSDAERYTEMEADA